MSKSLGNVVTIRDFLAEHPADAFRLLILGTHYRSPVTYNSEIAADARRKLERLATALAPAVGSREAGDAGEALLRETELAQERFVAAMDDDFGTPGALAALFDLVRAVNVARDAGLGDAPLSAAQGRLRDLASILGLTLGSGESTRADAQPFVELLVELRSELRKAKQFALADRVRERLAALGVVLEDGPQGTRWRFS
jgi:cysteinyl-tRNA synthetase